MGEHSHVQTADDAVLSGQQQHESYATTLSSLQSSCFLDSRNVGVSFIFLLQKRIVVQKAMAAWDDVSSALLHFLQPGHENATILGDTLSQVLKKDTSTRLSSDPVTIPGSGNSSAITFKLPVLGSSESDIMGIQVSTYSVLCMSLLSRVHKVMHVSRDTTLILH